MCVVCAAQKEGWAMNAMLVVLGGDLGEDLRSDERKETIDFEDVQLRRW